MRGFGTGNSEIGRELIPQLPFAFPAKLLVI